jgi:UDP-glucuronate decarboxylase
MKTPDEVTGPINVGNPTECTILELAETIIGITRSSSRIAFLPASQDDPKQRRPDISLAKERLGWTPSVGLEEGLEKTVFYFRQLASS